MKKIVLSGIIALAGCASMPTPTPPDPGGPLPGLGQQQLMDFEAGKAVFERTFEPPQLGPLFNATSCAACHEVPVTGGSGGLEEGGEDIETHASRFAVMCDELQTEGGPVFQHHTTAEDDRPGPPLPRIPPSADLGFGHRTTPPLFGLGLLEAIPDSTLERLAASGIGRVHRLPDGSLGRFGRKATDPNLAAFTAGAFRVEQGIEIPAELSLADLDLTVAFMRFLAPPERLQPPKGGARLFERTGCAECHIPSLMAESPDPPLNRMVDLYSDLLLHDMAAVDMCRGDASPREFRTAPLMGVRFLKTFMHDGRAPTIRAAILAHGGQGSESRRRFEALSMKDQQRLLDFVKGL